MVETSTTAIILAADVVRRGPQFSDPSGRLKIIEGWDLPQGRVLAISATSVLAEMLDAAAAVACANDIQDEIGGALAQGGRYRVGIANGPVVADGFGLALHNVYLQKKPVPRPSRSPSIWACGLYWKALCGGRGMPIMNPAPCDRLPQWRKAATICGQPRNVGPSAPEEKAMFKNPIVLGGIVVVLAVVAVVFMTRPANSVRDGVFTLAQAAAGQDLYPSTCPRCHGRDLYGDGFETPALIGIDFQRRWADGTLADLFEFVSTNMPKSNPGVFDDQTYLDLIAYILRINGYNVGKDKLVPDMEALAGIRMEMVN